MARTLVFDRPPSILRLSLQAFLPVPRPALPFAPVCARAPAQRTDPQRLASMLRHTGQDTRDGLPFLYPQVLGFPLSMAILTHPSLPIPIWKALQTRNRLIQHRPAALDAVLDLQTCIHSQRVLDKGLELDLRTEIRDGDGLVWEAVTTIYYRGRFGTPETPSPLARPPALPDALVARFQMPPNDGIAVGRLTADFNPAHWWPFWARRAGYRGAFSHPQPPIGLCLQHLAPFTEWPRRMDAWIRGPVYYDDPVELRGGGTADDRTFALHVPGDERPALIGRLRQGAGALEAP